MRRQHTEPVSSPAKVVSGPGLPDQLRKGSRLRATATAQTTAEPQPFATDSVSKSVKQEASTDETEAVRFVSTEPVKPPRARKRKQPEAHHTSEPDASSVLAQTAAAADGKQPVTASSSPNTVGSPQRHAKASVKGKSEDVTLLADAADIVQQASLSVNEPVSNPAKSLKQQKPRAKAVIKSEVAAVTEPTGAVASAQQAEPTKDSATVADTSGKPCKQRKPKARVKTETVVVKEDLASPDAYAAALSDESAKKSKPRKPRAKKVLTVEQLLESVDVVPYRERVMPKKWVGAHVSMGGGLERAVVRAASIGDVHGLKGAVLCLLCFAVLCCAVLCRAVLSLPATLGHYTLCCPGIICMFYSSASALVQVELTCSLVYFVHTMQALLLSSAVLTCFLGVHISSTDYSCKVVPLPFHVLSRQTCLPLLNRALLHAGANAFALDTRSKRQWESKPIEVDTADKFKQACKDYGFGPEHILPHGSYLINLASADPALLIKSYNAFVDELKRCEILGIRYTLT